MKAVIVEIKGSYAAVLSDDGCITKVANKNYVIGQVIKLEEKKTKRISRRIMATALSATAVFALFTASAWAYFTPYYEVSLDVNPSIEYKLNRFDIVIDVKALNDDGEEILNNLNLKNQGVDNAIEKTLEQLEQLGYIGEASNGAIVISAYCENEEACERLRERLQEKTQECLQERNINATLECVAIGYERVQEAQELNTTPGKLNLVEKLKESSDDPDSIDVEYWLNQPVKDIMKAINDNKKDDSNNNGNGQSKGTTTQSQNGETTTTTTQSGDAASQSDQSGTAGQGPGNSSGSNGNGN